MDRAYNAIARLDLYRKKQLLFIAVIYTQLTPVIKNQYFPKINIYILRIYTFETKVELDLSC